MSTRATYSFVDEHDTFHVYKHSDGYMSGAYRAISEAMRFAWPMPRFEPDEFATAFITANKTRPGGLRLLHDGVADDVSPGDIDYRYVIEQRNGALWITAYDAPSSGKDKDDIIFEGTLSDMKLSAEPKYDPDITLAARIYLDETAEIPGRDDARKSLIDALTFENKKRAAQ